MAATVPQLCLHHLRLLAPAHAFLPSSAPLAEEKQRQREAFARVREVLQARWPASRVHLFGSVANGLSVRSNNDLDVCLEMRDVGDDQVRGLTGGGGGGHWGATPQYMRVLVLHTSSLVRCGMGMGGRGCGRAPCCPTRAHTCSGSKRQPPPLHPSTCLLPQAAKGEVASEVGEVLKAAAMAEVLPLPKARVPVVKFVVPETGTKVRYEEWAGPGVRRWGG